MVFTYDPADWILYTDNMNEYEFNNDARPMFLSVDEDEASYIGPARKQSRNDTKRPPRVGIALFALSTGRSFPLEGLSNTDSSCRLPVRSRLGEPSVRKK